MGIINEIRAPIGEEFDPGIQRDSSELINRVVDEMRRVPRIKEDLSLEGVRESNIIGPLSRTNLASASTVYVLHVDESASPFPYFVPWAKGVVTHVTGFLTGTMVAGDSLLIEVGIGDSWSSLAWQEVLTARGVDEPFSVKLDKRRFGFLEKHFVGIRGTTSGSWTSSTIDVSASMRVEL